MSEQNNTPDVPERDPRDELPFNALPAAVVALSLAIIGIELLFQIGSYGVIGGAEAVGWRIGAIERYGFFDQVFEAMRDQGTWPTDHLIRFFSYGFVHTSLTHAAMACVFILALGKMCGEVFGNAAVFAVFFVSTLAGALVYGLLIDPSLPLLGAFPAAYGFVGAYSYILWVGLGASGENQFRAFTLIGFLLAVQLIFGLIFGGGSDWIADLAGFVAGFTTAMMARPGALAALLIRLRRR